jgi:cytochrome c peroxidase
MKVNFIFVLLAVLASGLPAALAADPPEVLIGERLFLETRFAQYFQAHAADVNAPLAQGDPTVESTATTGAPLPGPFAGTSINCRSCHLVDEQLLTPGAGMRTYADFARQSPIPAREDGLAVTPRNSPSPVGAAPGIHPRLPLHFDGEFRDLPDLVAGTLTGRNFGWLPNERAAAVGHIANVIRNDDGRGALAQDLGGAYRHVLAGSAQVPVELLLPARFRIDVATASDEHILRVVSRLIAAYVGSLAFERDEDGFAGAPFDEFLLRNALPRVPQDETALAYSRRLARALRTDRRLSFVLPDEDATFAFHNQTFRFGSEELRGLRIFLREPGRQEDAGATGIGNCVACHTLPRLTDFQAHNTGVTQRAYDAVHGAGSFTTLPIPDLATRNASPDLYLPASPTHPLAVGPFRALATAGEPSYTDLGMWNIFANPDFSRRGQQRLLAKRICRAIGRERCQTSRRDPALLLDGAVALFKTPGLRDLGHSGPYLHDGSADTLEDVVQLYMEMSGLARAGAVRNAAPELAGVHLGPDDVAPLAAFLRALNVDYE